MQIGSLSWDRLANSGMRVLVVRAVGQLPALIDARSVKPRQNIAVRPHAAPAAFGVVLNSRVLALGVARLIKCEPISHKSVRDVDSDH